MKYYDVSEAPIVPDVTVSKNKELSLPDFNGRYKLSSASEYTDFIAGDKIGPLSCDKNGAVYNIAQYDANGCVSPSTTFKVNVGVTIDKETNMEESKSCVGRF